MKKKKKPSDFARYQRIARSTALYGETISRLAPEDLRRKLRLAYVALGLAGETGETTEKIKKHIRGDGPLALEELGKEIGDILWYLASLATELGLDLGEIAAGNNLKLRDRKRRRKLKGSGDKR